MMSIRLFRLVVKRVLREEQGIFVILLGVWGGGEIPCLWTPPFICDTFFYL